MGKVEWTISVPEEPAREIEETASEVGLSRDVFVWEVLRVGLDHRSREAGRRARRSSRADRARRRSAERVWRCPGDWAVFDRLVTMVRDRLAAHPLIEREALKRELTEAVAVASLPAEDPGEVVERALDHVLGRPGVESVRDLPGEHAHKPPSS